MADVKKQMEPSSSIRPEVITENQAIGLEVVDGHAVKAPADYQDPEELYQILINKVKTSHPSGRKSGTAAPSRYLCTFPEWKGRRSSGGH